MRTAAQVGEVALGVCGDVSVFEFADKLAFVLLAAVAEKLEGVCFGNVATYHGVGGTCQFEHLGLDAREVGGGDGIACIVPLLEGGKLPGQELLQSITDYVSQKQYRYLTDKLVVKAPTEVNYNIDLTYYIDREDATTATAIQKAVDVAVNEYVKWQQKKLGRNVDPSDLIYLLRAAGARKIAVNEPTYTEVAKDEIASAKNIVINFGGWEDE